MIYKVDFQCQTTDRNGQNVRNHVTTYTVIADSRREAISKASMLDAVERPRIRNRGVRRWVYTDIQVTSR